MTSMTGEEVFHYTDLEALVGIVTTQSLWATDAQFLNDSEELRHAQEACCRYLERRAESHRKSNGGWAASLLEEAVRKLRPHEKQSFPYVLSFTSNGDQLSQWRGYGRFGQGVSIGFRFGQDWGMVDVVGHDLVQQLYKCLYHKNEQDLLFEEIVNCHLLALERETAQPRKELLQEWADWLVDYLTDTFPYVKCIAFEEEEEVRIAIAPGAVCWKERFRVANGMLVPYIAIHDEECRLPITRVIVGPSARQELIALGVRKVLDAHDYKKVAVERSCIPFRG